MKSLIRPLVFNPLRRSVRNIHQKWFATYSRDSFSQEGEDLILARFFEHREIGFYVDVGAHHPIRFSNTYLLYRRGWKGLNIDASPGCMARFRRLRPRDINVEAAIAAVRGELKFYVFNEPALNTFDEQQALRASGGAYSIVNEVSLPTRPLWELLEQYVPHGVSIDLLSVDVEGLDYDVLRSNDWKRYSPEYVLVECLISTLDQVNKSPIGELLGSQSYSIVAKTMNTVLFKRNL